LILSLLLLVIHHYVCFFQGQLAENFFNDGRSFDLEGEKLIVEVSLRIHIPIRIKLIKNCIQR